MPRSPLVAPRRRAGSDGAVDQAGRPRPGRMRHRRETNGGAYVTGRRPPALPRRRARHPVETLSTVVPSAAARGNGVSPAAGNGRSGVPAPRSRSLGCPARFVHRPRLDPLDVAPLGAVAACGARPVRQDAAVAEWASPAPAADGLVVRSTGDDNDDHRFLVWPPTALTSARRSRGLAAQGRPPSRGSHRSTRAPIAAVVDRARRPADPSGWCWTTSRAHGVRPRRGPPPWSRPCPPPRCSWSWRPHRPALPISRNAPRRELCENPRGGFAVLGR